LISFKGQRIDAGCGETKISQGVNRDEAKGRQGAFLLHQVQKSMNIVHLKQKRVERRGSSMSWNWKKNCRVYSFEFTKKWRTPSLDSQLQGPPSDHFFV